MKNKNPEPLVKSRNYHMLREYIAHLKDRERAVGKRAERRHRKAFEEAIDRAYDGSGEDLARHIESNELDCVQRHQVAQLIRKLTRPRGRPHGASDIHFEAEQVAAKLVRRGKRAWCIENDRKRVPPEITDALISDAIATVTIGLELPASEQPTIARVRNLLDGK